MNVRARPPTDLVLPATAIILHTCSSRGSPIDKRRYSRGLTNERGNGALGGAEGELQTPIAELPDRPTTHPATPVAWILLRGRHRVDLEAQAVSYTPDVADVGNVLTPAVNGTCAYCGACGQGTEDAVLVPRSTAITRYESPIQLVQVCHPFHATGQIRVTKSLRDVKTVDTTAKLSAGASFRADYTKVWRSCPAGKKGPRGDASPDDVRRAS